MTFEEAKEVFINSRFVNGLYDGDKWRESVQVISNWLEQEPVLNRLRVEIKQEIDRDDHADDYCDGYYDGMKDVLAIIDKYKAESEDKE